MSYASEVPSPKDPRIFTLQKLHHTTTLVDPPTFVVEPPLSRIPIMASSAVLSLRFLLLIASILALSAQAFAQSTTSTGSQHASTTTASIIPGESPWSYYGCWNETTLAAGGGGARALSGVEEDLTTMTADLCMAFCKSNSYTYAGIEYTKYVSPDFSIQSAGIWRFWLDWRWY
jgi:hypothetical protein